ncbi:MAG TPA: ABC transporter substrate-binding protein, partial [Terriglobales bacterium]|nr:ABC transporter substrate-binding protein [Terriglobales bacterium]
MRLNVSVVLLVCFLALTEDIVLSQQPYKLPKIGFIAFSGSEPPRAFMTGLRERGYIEGQSIIIEYRSAQGRGERLAQIAAELVRLKPDVIVAPSSPATVAAQKATTTIPIVFTYGDPVGMGTVGSLAHPGKNLTGLDSFASELAGKRLELLRDAFPKISRVTILLHADARSRRHLADMQNVAQPLGIQLQALEYRNVTVDLDSVFHRAINQRANALVVPKNPVMTHFRELLVHLAAKYRLPVIYPNSQFVDTGGLMSYGPDYRQLLRRAAYYVDRILKGAKPADLPVEQPTKF